MLGAHIIETYSGLPYQDFVAERVFMPLNMSTSTLWPSEATSSGLLTDTWTKDGRRIPFWFTDEISQVNAGPGGVISSAEDMVSQSHVAIRVSCIISLVSARSNGWPSCLIMEFTQSRGR